MGNGLGRAWVLALVAAMAAGAAVAGEGNTLYLVQESEGAGGNTFWSDQSDGKYTAIGNNVEPAVQRGSLNEAQLTLSGDCTSLSNCGTLAFEQDNRQSVLTQVAGFSGSPHGNKAVATISGVGTADISQIGDGNLAMLSLDEGTGTISQQGLGNVARLQITGKISGSIDQNGDNNVGDIAISGPDGASVTLVQQGNNLNFTGATPGVQYGSGTTNPGGALTINTTTNITITQTSWN